MKKLMLVSLIVIVAVLVLGTAGYAYAQTQQPGSEVRAQGMMGGGRGGRGMMGGGYGMMGAYDDEVEGYGPMHDAMLQGFAGAFGLTVEELQAQLDAGETMYTIAEAQGFTLEQFRELMLQVRTDALNQLVADGTITQEQADWMLSHMSQMGQGGYGPGAGGSRWAAVARPRWSLEQQLRPAALNIIYCYLTTDPGLSPGSSFPTTGY
jgi:hypothetical protein